MKKKNVLSVFKSTRGLVICALLAAFSAVFGKFLSINIGDSIRFSFENMTIILAGYVFGPVAGGMVGIIADLLGCLIKGFSINPFITLGAMTVGVVAGLAPYLFRAFEDGTRAKKWFLAFEVFFTTFAAHIAGNMIVKSVAMAYSFGTPMKVLALRVPIYVATGLIEGTVIYLLMRSKAVRGLFEE